MSLTWAFLLVVLFSLSQFFLISYPLFLWISISLAFYSPFPTLFLFSFSNFFIPSLSLILFISLIFFLFYLLLTILLFQYSLSPFFSNWYASLFFSFVIDSFLLFFLLSSLFHTVLVPDFFKCLLFPPFSLSLSSKYYFPVFPSVFHSFSSFSIHISNLLSINFFTFSFLLLWYHIIFFSLSLFSFYLSRLGLLNTPMHLCRGVRLPQWVSCIWH